MAVHFIIVTPNYNGLAWLPNAVASVRDQGRAGFTVHHHVQDGGSMDGSVEWLKEQVNTNTGPFCSPDSFLYPSLDEVNELDEPEGYSFSWASESDKGMYDALNRGFHHVKNHSNQTIFAWLNGDEQYLPGTLETVASFFEANPTKDLLFGGMLMVDEAGDLLSCRKAVPMRRIFLETSYLYNFSCGMFFRKPVFEKVGGFNPMFKNAGDEDFVLRLLREGASSATLDRYLATFVYAGNNLSSGQEALVEHEQIKTAHSWVSRWFKRPLNVFRLAEKYIRGGHVQKEEVTYAIYAGEGLHRVEKVDSHPSCKWPDHARPYLSAHRIKQKKRVAIDLVPIRVGEGGTGSGIWTYARELLLALDQDVPPELDIICLINEGQQPFLPLEHIQTVVFSAGRKNSVKRLFWVHVQLPRWCLSNRVDVLHKVATEVPLFCSAKRVTTVHDFYYEYLSEQRTEKSMRLYERFEKFYFGFATRLCIQKSKQLIAVSDATRQEAEQRHATCKDRIVTIHHGAPNIPISNPDPKLPLFRIACVAKFMPHKGQHLLIRAFEILCEKHPEWTGKVTLTLRGFQNDQAYYAQVQNMVAESRFGDDIDLVPYNAQERLESIYATSDVVVLLSDYEGFGLPVLEAQSFGIPVICSALEVLKEVGGSGAVYVERDSAEEVADVLFQFMDDPVFYKNMKFYALENVKRFSWHRAAAETCQVYRRV